PRRDHEKRDADCEKMNERVLEQLQHARAVTLSAALWSRASWAHKDKKKEPRLQGGWGGRSRGPMARVAENRYEKLKATNLCESPRRTSRSAASSSFFAAFSAVAASAAFATGSRLTRVMTSPG